MSPEEFRKSGYEVVDWIADYLAHTRDYPVLPTMSPGDLAAKLPAQAPDQGEPMDRILADYRNLIVPAVTHWNHPNFYAYFASSGSAPQAPGPCHWTRPTAAASHRPQEKVMRVMFCLTPRGVRYSARILESSHGCRTASWDHEPGRAGPLGRPAWGRRARRSRPTIAGCRFTES